jgi:uncharacterized protein with LGFP repeats
MRNPVCIRSFRAHAAVVTVAAVSPDRRGGTSPDAGASVGLHRYRSDRAAALPAGGRTGLMGFPTSDQRTAADGVGTNNHFQGGSIEVNGRKALWAAVIAVNWIGPLSYFPWGRRG